MLPPINLNNWIEENRGLLKPPVGNKVVYDQTQDFIVMVVGGPNSRKDFHFNKTEELFYQLEGNITVRTIQNDVIVDVDIKEGEMFLLPGSTYHSPQRGPNTVGLVIEKVREETEMDSFAWFCENCHNKLYEKEMPVKDIVKDLPPVMESFYADENLRTCDVCGTVMQPPQKII